VIFIAYAAFGVYAFKRDNELTRQLAFPLAISGISTAVWMVVQQTLGAPVVDLILLLPLVWFSWLATFRFDRMRGMGGSAIKWTTDVLTGLLSGWTAVAFAISVPRAARDVLNQGVTDSEWIVLWSVLGLATFSTWVLKNWISRTSWYYAAVIWGLLGIMLNNWLRTGFGYFGWITLVFALWLVFMRLTRGANGAIRPQTQ